MHLCKTRPKKRIPAAYHRLWESVFYIPQGVSSVTYPSHNGSVFSQLCCSVPLLKQRKKNPPKFSVMLWRSDIKPYVRLRPDVSIARWAGCPCPYANQRERSPCPSEGLNSAPRGCRALAPRSQTLGARASTPVRSSRRVHRSRLHK